jgi:hypothetical protein
LIDARANVVLRREGFDDGACLTIRSTSTTFSRIFHRPVARGALWGLVNMPTVTSVGADRSNEAAVRCIETSPFDSKDVCFGTTDMNSVPGSLTARVYELAFV